MKKLLLLPLITILLAGCVADQKTRQDGGEQKNDGPVINVPAPQRVDTSELKSDISQNIKASADNTQNQLSGLITTSISKLETNVSELVKVQATMHNTADVELKARLDSTIQGIGELKVSLSNQLVIATKLEASMTALTEIKTEIGSVNTKLSSVATGQAGIDNAIQNIKASAGRDNNFLPKEAVDIVVSTNKTWSYIMIAFLSLIKAGLLYALRNARLREENTNRLLMAAISELEPSTASRVLQK